MDEFGTYNDIEELYERKLHPKRDPCLKWVQDSLYNCLKLYFAEYLPLTDQTEGDLLRRIWSCVDTVFDFSSLKCRSGEKSRVSSSEGRNYDRCLGGVKKLTRKATGHKMDMIFKNESGEFGCAECGRFYDLNSTKKLMEGSFKLPKIMKDMLAHVCNDAPTNIRKLEIAGFIILENKITLMSLDVPAGYTCRINCFESFFFPTTSTSIARRFLAILELVCRARLIMESTVRTSMEDNSQINIKRSFKLERMIFTSYQKVQEPVKPRKRNRPQ
ncbi:hypothetical protein BD770DRAFT_367469 [Pilaira anomala]|nr:hypothetical protein BD770DRAFT_367469 [Pilaira anomala]